MQATRYGRHGARSTARVEPRPRRACTACGRAGTRKPAGRQGARCVRRRRWRIGRQRASSAPRALPQARSIRALPIAREAERIVELIRAHQVVVIAGETGSGKTTQLPKLCLAAGRGAAGMIGCTQPRRIAARAVARRVAEELQVPLGGAVGYQVRFNDNVGERHRDQVHDRRHPARRDPVRPLAVGLRHDHRRRGARAQPQHRFPARLPQAAAAQAPRPEGHRHLGDDRHRALLARISTMRRWWTSKAAAIRSRCAIARSKARARSTGERTVHRRHRRRLRRDHARGSDAATR